MTVSGGYGANVSGTTDVNGYYTVTIKPINIGGPFALNFAVISVYGTYNSIQSNLTVTAPIVVPVDKVLAGITIAGQTGTMPNLGSEEYPGWRRADVSLASMSGRVHLRIPLGAYVTSTSQQGGLMGVFSDDANFIPTNIKSGVSMFGLVGTYSSTPTHGTQTYSTPGSYSFTVPAAVNSIFALVTGGGGGGGSGYGSGSYTGSGGGGAGTTINSIAVTPGQVLTAIVASGGTGGIANHNYECAPAGGTSSFGGLIATGGNGGMNALYGSGYGGGGGTGTGYGSNGGTGAVSINAPPYVSAGGSSGGFGGSGWGGTGQRVGNGSNGTNGSVTILW